MSAVRCGAAAALGSIAPHAAAVTPIDVTQIRRNGHIRISYSNLLPAARDVVEFAAPNDFETGSLVAIE